MADTISGSLITREYKKFRGVDFSKRKDEVYLYKTHNTKTFNYIYSDIRES